MNSNETDLFIDPSIEKSTLKNTSKPFIVKGFLENNYYFYVEKLDRIVNIKSNQFKQRYLLKLANIEYWREHFGTGDRRKKSGVDWNEVELRLMSQAYEYGEFKGAAIRTRALRHPSKIASFAKNVEVA
jgi:hypothetical protein